MISRELGIVLRKSPLYKNRVWLVAESIGKVEVTIRQPLAIVSRALPGTLVSVVLEKQHENWHTNSLMVIAPPIIKTVNDYYWLHHILELYYYFTAPENLDDSLFKELTSHLSTLDNTNITEEFTGIFNMLCVIDFLVRTGFYASPALEHYQRCFKMIADLNSLETTMDIATKKTLDYLNQHEQPMLKKVITACLKSHPQYARFNTISFVYPS